MMGMIDINELKEWVKNWFEKHHYYHPYSKANDIPITELYDLMEQMPTVDAVPVVRCKDCKNNYNCEERPECDFTDRRLNGMDFCSRGERKDGADGETV